MRRVLRFIKALVLHAWHGWPTCDQKLIDTRFDICSRCPQYDADEKQCGLCGCNVNQQQIILNKLAWKDQKCPEGKW